MAIQYKTSNVWSKLENKTVKSWGLNAERWQLDDNNHGVLAPPFRGEAKPGPLGPDSLHRMKALWLQHGGTWNHFIQNWNYHIGWLKSILILPAHAPKKWVSWKPANPLNYLVELIGIEPTTSWMPFKRSPNWATAPNEKYNNNGPCPCQYHIDNAWKRSCLSLKVGRFAFIQIILIKPREKAHWRMLTHVLTLIYGTKHYLLSNQDR